MDVGGVLASLLVRPRRRPGRAHRPHFSSAIMPSNTRPDLKTHLHRATKKTNHIAYHTNT